MPRNTSLIAFFVLTLGVVGSLLLTQHVAWAENGKVVMFTANWCASCREVVPVVETLAKERDLTLITIDVDDRKAPGMAEKYGLTIPSTDPPQVFLVNNQSAFRLFDGAKYRFGSQRQIRSTVEENLRQAKP